MVLEIVKGDRLVYMVSNVKKVWERYIKYERDKDEWY